MASLTPAPALAQDSGAACNMNNGACDFQIPTVDGHDGPGAPGDKEASGNPGTAGQPGPDITSNLQTAQTLQSYLSISPINAVTIGGRGGNGSDADAFGSIITNRHGGNGAPGQNGGAINLTVGPQLSGQAFLGADGSLTSGMTLISLGGQGGGGGAASYNSGQSGNGLSQAGGDGGTITANIAGSWSSSAGVGLYVNSQGGQGGGGDTATDPFLSPQGVDACYNGTNDGLPNCSAGAGNTVNVTVSGTVSGQSYGAYIASTGGNGGVGGSSDDCCDRTGGHGGDGGSGGSVTATLTSTGIAVGSQGTAAFYVASLGGAGGVGGTSNSAGKGGTGGNAGPVSVEIDGTVNTAGIANTYGVLAQSLGGVGGNGGQSGAWFNPISGDGNTGGASNTVTVTGSGAHITTPDNGGSENASALIAQSIGGGGGVGPDSNGWFAVGGNGGTASNGAAVSVTMTNSNIATFGYNSAAVVAQSIGGGGGKGGDACNSKNDLCQGVIVNMTIGGTGGGGGSGADATIAMLGNSYVATINKHSPGLEMQSIGGGGGDGGSAYGKVTSLFYGAAISVGGTGGNGGDGGTVNVNQVENNTGQVLTFDSDSYGILGQSIGGGGGNGGAATAKSIVKGSEETSAFPSQSLAMATGGSGGIAGSANAVYLQSSGLVATIGSGSVGILAQSIGGGGGNAGDASASASASGGNFDLAASLAFGGTGGAAGNGGNAEIVNHGLVLTTGESATGLMVQSIGGGGGNGGAGDTKSSSTSSVNQGEDDSENNPYGKSMGFSVGSGGSGGGAGTGANVTANNTGAIITLGDSAHGILAQTIGGGGGNAGGGAASTQGDIEFNLQIGGTGGNGGNTYYTGQVNVTNSGTIVTYGADANGILAQSIGGGGGNGGKAGTSLAGGKSDKAGGNGTAGDGKTTGVQATVGAIENNYAAKGVDAIGDYNTLSGALAVVNGLLGNSALQANSLQASLGDDDPSSLDDTAGSGGDDSDDNKAQKVSLTVNLGGNGGSGGAAGYVNVTNQAGATVSTMGKQADAIVAQSIGGGGGKGGSASTATSGDISGTIGVGGNGGNNGNTDANNGGDPTVNNLGTVYTIGALSSGIVAQSIAGGGGIGGSSSVTVGTSGNSRASGLSVRLGGLASTSNGLSEVAQVTNSGAIETRGHDSYGIIAQSISGGGGIVKTLATDLDYDGSSSQSGNNTDAGNSSSTKDFVVDLKLGQDGQTVSGNAGAVFVTTNQAGGIVTRGDNGVGILAQVVAAGGGLALGGKPTGTSAATLLGTGGKTGSVNSGLSTTPTDLQGVHVDVGANINTYGQGGVGVFAQSVGGSGGIAGDIGHTMQLSMMRSASAAKDYVGNGGDIAVTVEAGSTIATTGGNAPGIIAQSVGGGGGWITTEGVAYLGSAGGTGNGGAININVLGGISAKGGASAGIFAQSTGGADNSGSGVGGAGSGGTITITIGDANNICTNSNAPCAATVFGGDGYGAIAASVYVRNGSASNTITNYGVVNTWEPNDGYAFYFDNTTNNTSSTAALTVYNYGIVTGNTNINGNLHNEPGSTYVPLSTVSLGSGTLTNDGVLDIQGTRVGTTTVTGNYAGKGKVVFDADFVQGVGDKLVISGKATIAGQIEVDPSTIRNAKLALVTATGGLTVDPTLTAAPSTTTGGALAAASGASAHQATPLPLQLFTYKFDSDGTTLYATPQARFAAQASGLGGARQAVAGHLQSLFDSGELFDTGYTALANLQSPAAYAATLESLTGQALGGIAAYRYQASRRFVSDVNGGCDPAGEATCTWARVQAGHTTQDATADALGYDAVFQIYEMGAQTRIADGLYLGGALAYEHSKLRDEDRTSRIHGSSMLGAIGLRYRTGRFELVGSVDGGYGWYTSGRQIIVGADSATADARPRLWNIGVDLSASYLVALGRNGYLKPFAEVRGANVHSNAFAETSTSEFALDVMSQSDFAVSGTLGASLGTVIDLGDGTRMKPFLAAAVEFSGDTDWNTSARFATETGNTAPFTVQTRSPGTFGRFGIGADLASGPDFDLTLSYNPEVGNHYITQQGVARLTYRF